MESRMKPLGMGELATDIADGVAEHADLLRCEVHTLGNGARVIDCGVNVPGGYDAGLALAEICMGGLGNIALGPVAIGTESWPGVTVWTDDVVAGRLTPHELFAACVRAEAAR